MKKNRFENRWVAALAVLLSWESHGATTDVVILQRDSTTTFAERTITGSSATNRPLIFNGAGVLTAGAIPTAAVTGLDSSLSTLTTAAATAQTAADAALTDAADALADAADAAADATAADFFGSIGSVFALRPAMWLAPDSIVLTPAQAVTPVVSRWADKSGRGNHATQASNGSRPTWTPNAINGHPGVAFGSGKVMDIPALSWVEAFVVATVTTAGNATMIASDGTNTTYWMALSASPGYSSNGFASGSSESLIGHSAKFSTGTHIFSHALRPLAGNKNSGDATEWIRGIDGAELRITATWPAFQPTKLGASLSYSFSGTIAEVLVFDHALTETGRDSVFEYLQTKYGTTWAGGNFLLAVGDSNTQGHNMTIAEAWPGQLLGTTSGAGLLGTAWNGYTAARGGNNAADMLADSGFFKIASRKRKGVAFVVTSLNDCTNGASAATAAAYYSSLCARLKALGWRVGISYAPPRTGIDESTVRTPFNLEVADFVTDGVADAVYTGTDSMLFGAGQNLNATWYQDGTHWTTAAQTRLAGDLQPTIEALAAMGQLTPPGRVAAEPGPLSLAGTEVTGTLPVTKGGTGQAAFTDGQLLIGNTGTGGLSKSTLTAGSGVTITNGSGTITIAATDGGSLPDQTGNSGKFLTTNGTAASWSTINTAVIDALNASTIFPEIVFASDSVQTPLLLVEEGANMAAIVANLTTDPTLTITDGSGTIATREWVAAQSYATSGAATGSGLTMATARILGRSTAGTGALEEITVGTGLSLSAGTLSATGGGGSIGGGVGSVDNTVPRADGTGAATLQGSDITITDAATSTTNNVAILNAHAGQTNSSLVLGPKGSGAIIFGPVPTGSSTTGNARGANAFDGQTLRNAATQVASGTESVALGSYSTANGARGVAIGYGVQASGTAATAVGGFGTSSGDYSFSGGFTSQATAAYAAAFGAYASASHKGEFALSGGRRSVTGDAQTCTATLFGSTTGNTATEIFLDGASAKLTVPSGQAFLVSASVVGKQSGSANVYGAERRFLIVNNSGTTALDGSVQTVGTDFNTPAWGGVTITADDTGDYAKFTVTGASATTIYWVITLRWTVVG